MVEFDNIKLAKSIEKRLKLATSEDFVNYEKVKDEIREVHNEGKIYFLLNKEGNYEQHKYRCDGEYWYHYLSEYLSHNMVYIYKSAKEAHSQKKENDFQKLIQKDLFI
jgi:hypothetical protein